MKSHMQDMGVCSKVSNLFIKINTNPLQTTLLELLYTSLDS